MLILLRRSRLIKCAVIVAFTFLIVIYLMQAGDLNADKKYGISDNVVGPRVIWSAKIMPVFQTGGKLGNFEPINKLLPEHYTGPGENGTPFFIEQSNKFDIIGSPKFGMNIAVSDAIALNRSIPDTRQTECRFWRYPELLPNASVVIVFHNEGLSVLLRTVHSVLNRTPPQYLHEILLVDDFSDMDHLRGDLEEYISKHLAKSPVRLVRNGKREGLIRSKSFGAKEAGGEVVVFLDAHCEVNVNWLVPLLAPIARDPNIMTVPTIDGIDHETFQYRTVYEPGRLYRGIFEWGMLYKETELPESIQNNRKYNSEPYKSPTHAGGLFAINRKYFLQLNAYDPGLLVWGGENFELSFKIWQCGGSIEWVPCSRVGHVYRSYMPYDFGDLGKNKKGPLITINYKRVIETWFDAEYKNYFYTREPLAQFLDMGNISAQLQLKENLKCRNFEWFMQNVAFDVYKKFPKLPINLYWGELKTNSSRNICLDCLKGDSLPALVQMRQCHHQGSNQLFRLNAAGQLGVGERCIEVENRFDDTKNSYELRVIMAFCRLGSVDGPWQYDQSKYFLYNRLHKKCMTLNPKSFYVSISPCDTNNVFQAWYFRQFNPYV